MKRCATHRRRKAAEAKSRRQAAYVEKTYSITEEEYQALYEAQGGKCAICQRATGKTKRLAVDHDHSCCPGPVSCGRCVRGLLDSVCNRMLGHFRDDPEAFERAAQYLRQPPALTILKGL